GHLGIQLGGPLAADLLRRAQRLVRRADVLRRLLRLPLDVVLLDEVLGALTVVAVGRLVAFALVALLRGHGCLLNLRLSWQRRASHTGSGRPGSSRPGSAHTGSGRPRPVPLSGL